MRFWQFPLRFKFSFPCNFALNVTIHCLEGCRGRNTFVFFLSSPAIILKRTSLNMNCAIALHNLIHFWHFHKQTHCWLRQIFQRHTPTQCIISDCHTWQTYTWLFSFRHCSFISTHSCDTESMLSSAQLSGFTHLSAKSPFPKWVLKAFMESASFCTFYSEQKEGQVKCHVVFWTFLSRAFAHSGASGNNSSRPI